MKNIKKLGALLLALVLILSVSAPAFADGEVTLTGGKAGATTESLNSSVKIEKNLKVFNPDESAIYAPNISYSYAIAQTAGRHTITDTDNISAQTNPETAPTGSPTITASLSWASSGATVNAAAAGADNKQDIVVSFASVTFNAAGVYRYEITETADSYAASGVTSGATGSTGTNEHKLYLDVYVKDGTPSRVIYGYVLSTADADINKTDDAKVAGFEDEYYTSNLKVTKDLVDDAAMNNHQFPFNVAFAGQPDNGFRIKTSKSDSGAAVTDLADKTYTDADAKIADGGWIKYSGLPAGVTATVYETNDVTGTTYESKATSSQGAAAEAKNITWTDGNNQSNNATMTASTADAAGATVTIDFTNTLKLISPTGVVLRVAPYILMLAAGVVLFVLSRRRRTEEEA